MEEIAPLFSPFEELGATCWQLLQTASSNAAALFYFSFFFFFTLWFAQVLSRVLHTAWMEKCVSEENKRHRRKREAKRAK